MILMQEINEMQTINAFDNHLSCEEAILKNESSGNSYLINDPSKLNIFPNYLIGNLKSMYFINNEKYIGEGVGILVGEDVILTSAHNLIFSQLEDGNIINYKPHSISFHLLSNGYLEILEPINCHIDSIIYSDYFNDFKFVGNQEINNTTNTIKNKDLNLRKNTDNYKIDENIIDKCTNNNYNNNNIEYKSKSSDYTSLNGRRLSKKLNINNISEIPLGEDYAIIFTEVNIGLDVINLFCDKETKLYNDLNSVDEESRLFKVFENHINFIDELENSDSNKFKNSKISMLSSIKYNSSLLGVPQYVYGSHLNDLNNKIFKNKKQTNALKIEDNKNDCKITLTEAKIGYNTPLSSYDCLRDDNNLENSRCTVKNRKWEKEFKHCLFINYDRNSNKKNLRNAQLDNLRKLMSFNCEEFYLEGKLVQCEARGKLCSLLFEKLRKTPAVSKGSNNLNNLRYEVNNEKPTPYFNRQNKENDEKSNREESIHVIENKEDLSYFDLNNNDILNRSISIFKDLSCPEILEDINFCNSKQKGEIIYNKIFKEKLEEILKYSFSENMDIDINKSKETQNHDTRTVDEMKKDEKDSLIDSINNHIMTRRNSIVDKNYKNTNSTYNQTKLNQMKEFYLKHKEYVSNTLNSKDASLPDKSRNLTQIYQMDVKNKINYETEDLNIDKNELNYMITTYKGQSGSPLFIRIKNEKLIEMQREDLINCANDKYSFIFLGLHSRSPEYFEPINKQKYQNGFFHQNMNGEIKTNSQLNLDDQNIQNKRQIINININLNEEFKDLNININLNSLIEKQHNQNVIGLKDPSGNILNRSNEPLLKKELAIKEFLNKNNYCSYNVGLRIDVDILNKIRKSIIDKRSTKKDIEVKEIQEPKTHIQDDSKFYFTDDRMKIFNSEANFMLLNFYIYDDYFVKGIFNITSYMNILFDIASEFLEVDKKFILLKVNEEFFEVDECGKEFILRFFEAKGKFNNKKEHKGIFKAIINANFVININKYSDFISDKLFSKLRDNIRNFENNKGYDNSEKSNLKIIIRYIFNELQTFFEKSQTLYGLLYNAIKTKMINSS